MEKSTQDVDISGSPAIFSWGYWGVHPKIFFDLPSVPSLIIDVSIWQSYSSRLNLGDLCTTAEEIIHPEILPARLPGFAPK